MKTRTKYLKLSILIISICLLLGAMSACLPFGISLPDKLDESAVNDTAMSITHDTPDGLGSFNDGYSYVFTDKRLIDNFRAGNQPNKIEYPNSIDDLTAVKVAKTASNRGSQENPYVIASKKDWTQFAKDLDDGTIPSYGSGKYFVLAKDLDFATEASATDGTDQDIDGEPNEVFRPVRFFNGTFYGMGHSLFNISLNGSTDNNTNEWQCWSNSSYVAIPTSSTGAPLGYGVFCRTVGATITDLIVVNFDYKNMQQTESIGAGHYRCTLTGGIVGYSAGNDDFLNCHTSGVITAPKITYSSGQPDIGGVIGGHIMVHGTKLYMYRCSSEVVISINATSNREPKFGGLVADTTEGGDIYVYDCVANLDATSASGAYIGAGVICGFASNTYSAFNFENIVGTVKVKSPLVHASGALCCVWSTPIIGIKNCYVEGKAGETSPTQPMHGIAGSTAVAVNNTTVKNINVVKEDGLSYWNKFQASGGKVLSGHNECSTSAKLISDAKGFFSASPYSNIWDTSKIGGKYDPDNSPVRNYLLAFVNFRNLIGGGNDEESVDIEDGFGYVVGDTLPTIPDSYLDTKSDEQNFLGWTDDASGESDPFMELPSGMFGEVTLYAVWGLSDEHVKAYITPKLSVKDKINDIEYDSRKTIVLNGEVEYTGASHGGLTDPKVTYLWEQTVGTTKTKRSENKSATFTARVVKDSGKYTYDYVIRDKEQPLWLHKGSSDLEEEITIRKGKYTLDALTLNTDPYNGRKLLDVKFTATAKNSSNINVPLSSATNWKNTTQGIRVKEGSNTFDIVLIPTDTDNYESQTIVEYTFDSIAFYMTFKFPELVEELKAEIEYDQNYGPKEIIYQFDKVYVEAIADGKKDFVDASTLGLIPYLADEDEVNKDKNYRGAPVVADSSGEALYSKKHDGLTEELVIYVFFHEAYYKVKFDANSPSNTTELPEDEEYGYGKFVKEPDDPTNGEMLFLGWYFNETVKGADGKETTVYRAWRFYSKTITEEGKDPVLLPQDRVTGNLTLTAEWLTAGNLDKVTFEVNNDATFTAWNKVDSGDYLTVTGHYSGQKDGINAYRDKVISYGKYVVQYGTLDSKGNFTPDFNEFRVANGEMYLRVGVQFKGNTVYSDPQKIPVEPIDITDVTKKFNFGGIDGVVTFEYDGKGHTLPKMSKNDVMALTGGDITDIEYVYKDIRNNIIDEPTEIGTYSVTITYKTASDDYYAQPTSLTLKIRSTIKVNVQWTSNKLMYTAGAQYPKVAKVTNAETGEEILISDNMIEYSGDLDATTINIGKHYKVSVSFGDSYTVRQGEECEFDIVKAYLEIPKYESGAILYDGTTKVLEDYLGEAFNPLLMEITSGGTGRDVNKYVANIKLKDTINCSWADGSPFGKTIEWRIEPAILYVSWDEWEFEADGEHAFAPKISNLNGLVGSDSFDYEGDFIYKIYDENDEPVDVSEVDEIGSYRIVANFNTTQKNYTLDVTTKSWNFVVVPKLGMTIISIEWDETSFVYDGEVHYPTPIIKDRNGDDVTAEYSQYLKFSDGYYKRRDIGTYSVKVTLKGEMADEVFIRSGATCKYKITDEKGNAPDEDETNANLKDDDDKHNNGGGFDMDKLMDVLREYWKAIVSGICIILIIAFLAKAGSYNSRRKSAKKATEDRYKNYYATEAIGLFGLASSTWTVIMCVFIGLTVISFIIMLIAKSKCAKAEDNLAYAKEDFARGQADVDNRRREEEARQRDENMRMMLMSLFGGAQAQGVNNAGNAQPQGGYVFAQQGIGVEEMRGLIAETVTALLPSAQQALPQQASSNDELVQKLIEQNEKLMEKSQKNEDEMRELLREISKQNSERIIEREVASTTTDDETLKRVLDNQDMLMQKILELSANNNSNNGVQVVEKVVEKEVPVEKIVEKVVEVPVEVPVEVEKIVEKEVVKEVPVEKIVEVPVEKVVHVPAPAKPKKETAPRLTLDEAYALLSKEQKKYFDGLREYALSKPNCKEKKATYSLTIGQSTVNPLLKLTIKKDMTVALFKMEDEYLKDIKRDATSDGTKIKVKETEVIISDAQACKAAKNMIDLREDQIERYQDLLKEQRAMKRQ